MLTRLVDAALEHGTIFRSTQYGTSGSGPGACHGFCAAGTARSIHNAAKSRVPGALCAKLRRVSVGYDPSSGRLVSPFCRQLRGRRMRSQAGRWVYRLLNDDWDFRLILQQQGLRKII